MRFFKNSSNGGMETFRQKWGEASNRGWGDGGFILGGYKTFKVTILKSTLFYEDPSYITYTLFSKFCQPHLPRTSLPAISTPRHFCCPVSLVEWMTMQHLMCFFTLMIIWICTCQDLVRQCQKDLNLCFMQQGVKFTEV